MSPGLDRPKNPNHRAQLLASVSGTSSVASKYEELECLYAAVGKVIYEGLTNYEKATNANPSQLFGGYAQAWFSQHWFSLALLCLCSLVKLSLDGKGSGPLGSLRVSVCGWRNQAMVPVGL